MSKISQNVDEVDEVEIEVSEVDSDEEVEETKKVDESDDESDDDEETKEKIDEEKSDEDSDDEVEEPKKVDESDEDEDEEEEEPKKVEPKKVEKIKKVEKPKAKKVEPKKVEKTEKVEPNVEKSKKDEKSKKEEKPKKEKSMKEEKPKKEKPKKMVKKSDSDDDEPKQKRHVSAVTPAFLKAVKDSLRVDANGEVIKDICETFVKVLIDKVMEGESVQFTNHFVFKMKSRKGRDYLVPSKDKNAKPRTVPKPDRYGFSMTVRPGLKKMFDEIEVTDELSQKIKKTKKEKQIIESDSE